VGTDTHSDITDSIVYCPQATITFDLKVNIRKKEIAHKSTVMYAKTFIFDMQLPQWKSYQIVLSMMLLQP